MAPKTSMDKTEDPEQASSYLLSPQFHHKLPECPRTGLSITYADFGAPDGQPVLFVPPEMCSRWYAVPLDMLGRRSGIRLITVDRPGCGEVPSVPLHDRIKISNDLTMSVLDHLRVYPRHLISAGSGILYTIHLLINHSASFPIVPMPVLIAPWIPQLAKGEFHTSFPTMVPQMMIRSDSATGKVELYATDATTSTMPLGDHGVAADAAATEKQPPGVLAGLKRILPGANTAAARAADQTPSRAKVEKYLAEQKRWIQVVAQLSLAKALEEGLQGIADELALCNAQGEARRFERNLAVFADKLKQDGGAAQFDVWWGTKDESLPPQKQREFSKLFKGHEQIELKVHDVSDASNPDLYSHYEGLNRVFAMMHFRERVYYGG